MRHASKLGLILALAASWLSATVSGAAPPANPILRIETGMHTGPINSIAADKAGRFLVTASMDKTARVWDLSASGAPLAVLRPPIADGAEGALFGVAMSPNGQMVATAGATGRAWDGTFSVYLFDSQSGHMVRRISGLPSAISELAFSPNGQRLAVCMSGGGLRMIEIASGLALRSQGPPQGECTYVDVGPDGRVVTSWRDGRVRIYDAELGPLGQFSSRGNARPIAVRFSPDGQKIAVGYESRSHISVLSVDRGLSETILSSGLNSGSYSQVAWWQARNAVCAGGSAPITCWNASGPPIPFSSQAVEGFALGQNGLLAFSQPGSAWSTINKNGQIINHKKGIALDFRLAPECMQASVDLQHIKICYRGKNDQLAILDFDVPGRLIRVPGPQEERLYPTKTTSPFFTLSGIGSRGEFRLNRRRLAPLADQIVLSVDIAADDQWLALGTDSALFRLERTGQVVWQVATPAPALGVLGSLDGRRIVVAHMDGSVRWYNAIDGKEMLALFVANSGSSANSMPWVLWTPAGYYDASAEGERFVTFHQNHGPDRAAELISAAQMTPAYRRPDIISRALSRTPAPDLPPALVIARNQPAPSVSTRSIATPVSTSSDLLGRPHLHILAVGVAEYQTSELQRLEYPAADAKEIAGEFSRQFGGLYQEGRVTILLDRKATTSAINQALFDHSKEARQHDVSIIYLAGHADLLTANDEYVFLSHDYQRGQETVTSIPQQGLQAAIHRIPGKKILILDTCHAGQTAKGFRYRSAASAHLERFARELARSGPGAVLLAATLSNQLALETRELGHGAFTLALLEALRGCPISEMQGGSQKVLLAMRQEHAVKLTKLLSYLTERVKELTHGQQTFKEEIDTNPDADSDFPLATIDRPCSPVSRE